MNIFKRAKLINAIELKSNDATKFEEFWEQHYVSIYVEDINKFEKGKRVFIRDKTRLVDGSVYSVSDYYIGDVKQKGGLITVHCENSGYLKSR